MWFEEIPRPAPDHLTVPEAAERLGVSKDEVRRLIRSGEVPASKVGGRWLIPRTEIDHRLSLSPSPGRRLTPAMAWGLLFLADHKDVAWLTPDMRWRVKKTISSRPIAHLRSLLLKRGRPRPYRAHSSLVPRVREDPHLMLTGISATAEYGLGLIGEADQVEAYVGDSDLRGIVLDWHLRPSQDPNIILRVVPDFGVPWPPARFAPLPAVALDLLDSPEPRAQQVGREVARRIG